MYPSGQAHNPVTNLFTFNGDVVFAASKSHGPVQEGQGINGAPCGKFTTGVHQFIGVKFYLIFTLKKSSVALLDAKKISPLKLGNCCCGGGCDGGCDSGAGDISKQKKIRIQETLNLWTCADSRTNTKTDRNRQKEEKENHLSHVRCQV